MKQVLAFKCPILEDGIEDEITGDNKSNIEGTILQKDDDEDSIDDCDKKDDEEGEEAECHKKVIMAEQKINA